MGGYPACAGIDLDLDWASPGREGLPRMRGDRPLNGHRLHLLGGGYPACAGIDPPSSGKPRGVPWLPRMRGDRPNPTAGPVDTLRATPHARGSTSMLLQNVSELLGYPACAGIDLSGCPSACFGAWLPRMRGDRPPVVERASQPQRATPHARGSTPSSTTARPGMQGYPACAGIDPRTSPSSTRACRLPRMRGDRPCSRSCSCGSS